jgi:transketolase C-terminal domain/subunit
VIEDHYESGGLFSAICEAFVKTIRNPKIVAIAVPRRIGETGTDAQLRAAMGMDSASIRSRVIARIDLRQQPGN